MQIEHIEVINLRFAYPDGEGFHYAGGTATGRLTSLVLVHASGGQIGIGSVYSHPDLVRAIIEGHLRPLLLGRDPREVEELWHFMYRQTRWYGRKGAAMSSIGGVEMACWDLRGKAEGKSVASMLGAERRSAPAYASGLLWNDDLDALGDEARRHVDNGFRRVKMRLGMSEERDAMAVTAVRHAVGPEIDVIVDASMRYSLPVATRMGALLAELNVFWYEEPFEPEEIDRFVALQAVTTVPLAAGENEFGVQGFRELLRAGAVDIVQPDACRAGGIGETYRVGKLAQDYGVAVATHTWSDAVALTANAHVIAALPNGLTVEVDQTGNPFIDDLLVEPVRVRDGLLPLSGRPGLGIELNMETVDRLRVPPGTPVADGNYSDFLWGAEHLAPAPPYVAREEGA